MAVLNIKDGTGAAKELQVTNGADGIVTANTQAAVSTVATEVKYYPNGTSGWNYSTNAGTVEICDADLTRKSLIVHNSGTFASAYILISAGGTNNGFGTISDTTQPPSKYTFVLEPNATYFGDVSTCGIRHSLFVPSSSLLNNSIMISVTEIS